jgi:Putative zinc-finger
MKNRERDAAMEPLLRMALSGEHRPPASACLDADVLAAWADGGLAPAERAAAEAHAAGCTTCQATLAAMARTMSEEPVAAAQPSPLRRWMMFLGPAVTAAAAVVLWLAVDRQSPPPPAPADLSAAKRTDGSPVPSRDAEAAVQAPLAASPTELTNAVPVEERKKRESPSAARNEADERQAKEFAGLERQRSASAATPYPAAPAQELKDLPGRRVDAEKPVASPVVTAPTAAPAPTPPAATEPLPKVAAAQPSAPLQQADQQLRSGRAGGGAAGDVRAYGAATAAVDRAATLAETVASATMIVPGSRVRWRVTSGSTIEHSIDAGQTWATQYDAGAGVSLTAGIAVTPSAAWIVGRNGAVFVTADGRTWRRAFFPASVDLIAVTAADARTATVVAADKRQFATSDGGVTWR